MTPAMHPITAAMPNKIPFSALMRCFNCLFVMPIFHRISYSAFRSILFATALWKKFKNAIIPVARLIPPPMVSSILRPFFLPVLPSHKKRRKPPPGCYGLYLLRQSLLFPHPLHLLLPHTISPHYHPFPFLVKSR